MFKSKLTTSFKVLGASCLLAFASVSQAQIAAFDDDFEGYGTGGVPSATDFSPWLGFSDNGGFPGGYVYVPSTSGPQISALGYNGTDNQYLNFYANYDNVNVHDRGLCSPCSPNLQEELFIYRQMSFTGADTASGNTWVFSFNYREGDIPPTGSTEVSAYIRVFDPIFNILHEVEIDTSGSSDWRQGIISINLNPDWTSGFVQVGFSNKTGNYEDSGMFYDDVVFSQALNDIAYVTSAQGDNLHAHHDGGPGAIAGLNDQVRVILYGQSTLVGDPVDLATNQVLNTSVRFGPDSALRAGEATIKGIDVDFDGELDARFPFLMGDTGIGCTDFAANLTGETSADQVFAVADIFSTNCNAQCH